MTGKHRLWAVFWIALFAAHAIAWVSTHDGCIAFCTSIANARGH